MDFLLSHLNYVVSALLFSLGLFVVVTSSSRVKQLQGLGLFQTAVLVFYVSLGYVGDSVAPILGSDGATQVYSNPLPSVLMLTAIVVGVATMAVGLSMVLRIEGAR
ncbi:cation:proton antiporter subunit C [Anaplasma platys]|uniref:Cation:proton antiporter subunit C n=1 Tax=Anaplasma platys TaxID=949 RepID=A0A858PXV2_9RICK|nr:cation:proton antiporter subunit C [Anaplasma platys]QJC27402.1 cation:proton antiporter subunit C [Anaplasma platys]